MSVLNCCFYCLHLVIQSLTKATRHGGKNKEVVTEEKSSLLFTTQITLGKEQFNISVRFITIDALYIKCSKVQMYERRISIGQLNR